MSSPRPVVVRADAGPRLGVGHVMRCVALAEELAVRGHQVVFVADLDEVPWAHGQVTSRGFDAVQPPVSVEDEVPALLALDPDWVVLDSYELPGTVHAELLAADVDVLAFVDGDPTDRTGTVLVDQNIGAEDDTWALPDGVVRLAGLDYALMRTEILERRPAAPAVEEHPVPRVFAFFGGTDAYGAGPVLTRALIGTGEPFDLRVVAPSPWSEPIEPGPGQRVTVIGPTDELADEVLAADLVVSAAGTSSWELLCLGAACAFVCVADNQVLSYGRAVEAGLGLGLGLLADVAEDPASASAVLAGALADAGRRTDLRARAWARVDGRGRARVVDAFLDAR